ncbi:hypothetical protein LTR53_017304 [Teratosphaeriaceae sp. CCFEE 6253]|nr:hypothetical protein LTR53_017304 [Teratosphaeriaceae sp. CCFEE 6253]
MRGGARSRPVSHHGPQPTHSQGAASQATRKVFNCIVDDSALVAGVKRSTRNGIRQWVKNGQIRLFVPLHALDQLSRQKSAGNKHGDDVRETLQWLDDATTKYPHAVTLQGGDQYYQDWAEVERFTVPRTLFSEHDHEDEDSYEPANDLPESMDAKLNIENEQRASPVSSAGSVDSETATASTAQSIRSSISPVSPPTSPVKATSSPAKPYASLASAIAPAFTESATTPARMQPLFNYILWRVHQELDPVAALESFIFLCNDPQKVHYAKGFDIRCKRLEQLREAINREDRDHRNRMSMQTRETQQSTSVEASSGDQQPAIDEEVLFRPTQRGPPAVLQQPASNVIDPNAFGRTSAPLAANHTELIALPLKSPQSANSNVARGGMHPGLSPRGGLVRGNLRGGRGRGGFAPVNRGGYAPIVRAPEQSSSGQIDPDSFTRPRSGGFAGRGGARKLWVPT